MEENINHLMTALNEYAVKFKELYKEKLEEGDAVASGKLINSVSTEVQANGATINVILNVEDYFKYVEKGRKAGKFPPIDAIRKWIEVKPILPRPMANGKLPTEEQLTFLISRAIANNGTIKRYSYNGGDFVAKTVEELNTQYLPKLQEALQQDFDEYFSIYALTDINKKLSIIG